MTKRRVLIIDDSRTMQALISNALSADPDLVVAGFASNALEGRQAIKELDPDVVTLDIEMPGMNGLAFLEKIMTLRPTPVVMVSSLADNNLELVMKALAIGAIGCVAKPTTEDPAPFGKLAKIVRDAAMVDMGDVRRRISGTQRQAAPSPKYRWDGRIVAIGSSAGGVDALATVLQSLPENGPPIVIAQHMPAMFTQTLAAHLDRSCRPQVQEARDGARLLPGIVYVAPGGPAHLQVAGKGPFHCNLVTAPEVSGHRPSVDVLFRSVARAAGAEALGVILTGMGGDGAAGLLEMRQAGAHTIGQNAATSFIYGMPRVAFEKGAVERQLPLDQIGPEILASTSQKVNVLCP